MIAETKNMTLELILISGAVDVREDINGKKRFLSGPFLFGRKNSRFESHLRGGEGDILTT